jgi:4-diphosphocytidyl-2-C-methyl-D-erythritol kinase
VTALDLLSPAKLNLFLHVTGRRPDGYHTLQTLFQLLDFGDRVRVEVSADNRLELSCPGLDLPVEENLALRAAERLRDATGCRLGASIHIEKQIPAGGGLGGGSSNAATVLLALNRLWALALSAADLAGIGLALGADVPVFVHGHSAWAEGVGERLTPVEIPRRYYLVVAPDCTVSTAEVFSRRELTRNTSPITIATFFAEGGQNDCENVVRKLHPEVDKTLNWLEKFGPARLTGTGACAYLTFASRDQAREIQSQLPASRNSFIAGGLDRSPVLDALESPELDISG